MEWEVFKQASNIPADKVSIYLVNCCDTELKASVQKENPQITTRTEADILAAIKRHAVINVASSILQTELLSMRQDHSEPIRQFASRALGKARNCRLTETCTRTGCGTVINFSHKMVKLVVLTGMSDDDIKKDVLGTDDLDGKTLNETIAIIETKEMAARSISGAIAPPLDNASAAYSQRTPVKITANDKRLSQKGKCETCKGEFLKNRVRRIAGNDVIATDKFCKPCWIKKRAEFRNKKTDDATPEPEASAFAYMSSAHVSCDTPPSEAIAGLARTSSRHTVAVPNYIFDGTTGWKQSASMPQPTVHLRVSIDASDYSHLRLKPPKMVPTTIPAVTDTGAQSCLLGTKVLQRLGLSTSSLVPVTQRMHAINGENIEFLGALFLRLSGTNATTGMKATTAVMVYVTNSTDLFYISRQAMRQLGIINANFPDVGSSAIAGTEVHSPAKRAPCGCPVHSQPQARPQKLPFAPTPENIPKMKQWLLQAFEASSFNKCPHQPLPLMTGDPIRIHIDPDATPVTVYTAATVPVHWREQVKALLDQDEALGVIEKVPPGVPTQWQARMHVVPKHDGTPRRTVDLRPLNTHCVRETQHIVPPYKQARLVPGDTWRTVTDAWNGYHSVPLAEEDRHLTTFITEHGRYRYKVAPQGYLASGDGYNQRYDNVISSVPRKTKCVDDTLLWDDSLETHWWRVIDYLTLIGKNGIIINPKKFQFCERQVEFAGFLITNDRVKPLPKYLDAIRNFPRPTNISDIRGWFGLVNQVSHYAKLTALLAPFQPLLSPKTRFKWDDSLENAFQLSKMEIIKAIETGVQIFDPNRTTILSPDWSKTGIGYFLYQKYCSCPSTTTQCCNNGWRITLAGSRFLKKAEQNYWPVEGEALAVKWALEDTRFFTWGCTDLHIQTDHRPLVKLLGDRTLDEINNNRLLSFKEKTMPWKFTISYVPGCKIPAPDATSRKPDDRTGEDESASLFIAALEAIRSIHEVDDLEESVIAAVRSNLDTFEAVTWERVRDETSKDIHMLQLLDMAEHGFPDSSQLMSPQLSSYWRFRDDLSSVDGVLIYANRIVIPPSLRDAVCKHIHGAHQGISQMMSRATASVFWPGITTDIQETRERCQTCDTISPSQPHLPASEPFVAVLPFQAVATDYFKLRGNNYLLTVDRFTNWPDLRQASTATAEAGTAGLIKALRQLFAQFGVPEHLSSDGGPEYVSHDMKDFMRRWGINHRLSSAYHPQSNGRAEVAVKAMKRLLLDHVDESGSMDTDAVMRGMLQLRNTPERDSGLSPAQVLLGRNLRDSLPAYPALSGRTAIFDKSSPVDNHWKDTWHAKEMALRARLAKQVDKLDAHSHSLVPLCVGDSVRIQNQGGNHPNKWDKTGTVVQTGDNDQYIIRVDGSRRLTLRNRRFLRKFKQFAVPIGKVCHYSPPSVDLVGTPGPPVLETQPLSPETQQPLSLDSDIDVAYPEELSNDNEATTGHQNRDVEDVPVELCNTPHPASPAVPRHLDNHQVDYATGRPKRNRRPPAKFGGDDAWTTSTSVTYPTL